MVVLLLARDLAVESCCAGEILHPLVREIDGVEEEEMLQSVVPRTAAARAGMDADDVEGMPGRRALRDEALAAAPPGDDGLSNQVGPWAQGVSALEDLKAAVVMVDEA